MGLNKAFDRSFFLIGGNVKTSGGSINLAKGEFAAVNLSQTTQNGVGIVSSFAGVPKDKKDFALRVGIEDKKPNRSYSNKSQSTMPFSLNDVVDLKVSAPTQTEQSVDEVVLGWDGITPGSEFKFQKGDAYFRLFLELKGDAIGYRGGKGNMEQIAINVEVPECDPFNNCEACDECESVDCKAIVTEAIERLRRKQLTGGNLVEEFIDITPVFDCDNAATAALVPYVYYTLEVCDTGTDAAKALVEAQYDAPVIRIDRRGSTSTYQILLPGSEGAPADYEQSIASLIKDCEDCPAGYVEVPGGFLYAFTIEDDGTDQSALINAIPNHSAGTTIKSGNDNGVGFYTAVFTSPIPQTDINAFLAAANAAAVGEPTVEFVGVVSDICTNSTVTTTAWVEGDTCNAVEEEWSIILPDNKCGEDRLAELNGAYQNLTITIADSDSSTRELTLTGTSGTANVNVDGVNYLATFNVLGLNETADDFVSTHAAALAAAGVTVTAATGVLTFSGLTTVIDAITITNASGDLDGTLAASVAIPERAGCQTKYITSVLSNIVCDECDPIYLDFYVTEAPESYDEIEWVEEDNSDTAPSGNCKCGIRFKAKSFIIDSDESLRDITGFVETSTQIRVAAGYPEEIREGIGIIPKGVYEGKYLSRWVPRTHLAGNLRNMESEGRMYFQGLPYRKDYLGRLLRGETSNMEDQIAQYIQYTVTVQNGTYSQGFARRHSDNINYHFFVEVGRQNDLENILNDLAANAGVSPVAAFGA
jgi:hypothetical protein